jgi:hypothetical protein
MQRMSESNTNKNENILRVCVRGRFFSYLLCFQLPISNYVSFGITTASESVK